MVRGCFSGDEMIQRIFSVYDTKACAFAPPFVSERWETATRLLRQMMQDRNIMPSQYPEDFVIYELGEMDLGTGEIKPIVPPTSHGSLLQFVPSNVPQPAMFVNVNEEPKGNGQATVSDEASIQSGSEGDDSSV